MNEMDPITDLLGGGRTISYKTDLAHMTGSVTAGLLLSQFWHWTNTLPAEREGWFYKTADEMQLETGMGRTEAEGARKKLRDMGIVTEERRGVPAKLWYRIDKARLNDLLRHYAANKIAGNPQTGVQETRKLECRKSADKTAGSQQTITETTTKTTQRLQQPSTLKVETKPQAPVVVAFSASLLADVIAIGVVEKVARGLLKTYPEAAIRQQLEWLPQRKCEDPPATLVESIKQGYGAPAGMKKALPRPKRVAAPPVPPLATVEAEQAMRDALDTARKRVGGLRSSSAAI